MSMQEIKVLVYEALCNYEYLVNNFCPNVIGAKISKNSCQDKSCMDCWNKALARHKRRQKR